MSGGPHAMGLAMTMRGVNGLTKAALHYNITGDAKNPAVIFLHGFLGDATDWDEVVGVLNSEYRCLAVDLPGHGKSVAMGAVDSCQMLDTATAIIEVADATGLNRFSVVGYSMGGRLALYVAAMFPMRVDALVLESASPGLRTEKERGERLRADERWAHELEGGDVEAFLKKWYAQPLFASLQRCPERFEALLERRKRNDPGELARSLREMGAGAQPSLWKELAQHTMPTLLVTGGLDAKFATLARKMARRCPAMRTAVVSGCGHNVHFERPGEYTELLRHFLKAN